MRKDEIDKWALSAANVFPMKPEPLSLFGNGSV
jgi:hypothetical protein